MNFGSAGFFAIGVYSTVVIYKTLQLADLALAAFAAAAAGLVGLGMGYLALRLRGVFFSIATLRARGRAAHAGGELGVRRRLARRLRAAPADRAVLRQLRPVLVRLMLGLAIASVLIARFVEHSWLGRGLAALRDDETAAECAGVPALRLKLIATALSGAMMGVAGAPFPYFITYVDPHTAFSLAIAVNTIAMPLIGGTTDLDRPGASARFCSAPCSR